MKRKILTFCLVAMFIFGFSGLVSAESVSIYSDLPTSHWAYGAVAKLAQTGIVQGDAGKFNGDRAMTRYEMAQIVANAVTKMDKADDESKTIIQNLKKEFANELQVVDVRLTKLESKAPSFKIGGDFRIRFRENPQPSATNLTPEANSKYDYRARLTFSNQINPNLTYKLRLLATNDGYSQGNTPGVPTTTTKAAYFDQYEIDWVNKKLLTQVGGIAFPLGKQYITWSADGPAQGINFVYTADKNWSASAALIDLGTCKSTNFVGTTNATSVRTALYSLQYKKEDNTTVALVYKDVLDPERMQVNGYNYMFKEWNLNAEIPSGDFLMHFEAIKNKASGLPADAQTSGYLARLKYRNADLKKPGSTAYYLEYIKMGNWATDSSWAFNDYNGCNGNGVGKDGAKGWGVGVRTVIIPDADFSFWYYKWKPYDAGHSTFTDYHPSIQTQVTFRF